MLELFLSDQRALMQDVLAISLIGIAFAWGAGPERAFAISWLAFFEIGPLISKTIWPPDNRWAQIETFLATMDVLALGVLLLLALFSNRNYTLWIAAMQLLAVTAHVARGLVETISPVGYAVMVFFPGWLQLCFFALGLIRHVVRHRNYGPYRDWRLSHEWAFNRPNRSIWQSIAALLGHDFFPVRTKR